MSKKKLPNNYIVLDAMEFDPAGLSGERIELCVALSGEWKSRDLRVTDTELSQMLTNFQNEGRDILFDYDHHCLGGLFSDGDSRAAGWGKSMRIENGALIVEMEPTARGREAIESGEFRYLSPVYEYQRQDRVSGKKLTDWRLHSVALTNVPYLQELPAIKNTETEGSETMDELLKRLDATDEDGALAALQDLCDRIEALEAQVNEQNLKLNEAAIDAAIAAKQLLPAHKALAEKLINTSRELYDEFVKNAAVPDLTQEVLIHRAADDGLDPFHNVQSFADLLQDPAVAKQMQTEQPARYNELYQRFMKEGR
jgi:phage I-like protein